MLTVFTTSKDFTGEDERNQVAALKTWLRCESIEQIILYGDALGAEEFCAANGIVHVKEVPTTALGTPLMDAMYNDARQRCKTKWLGFLNCDIILPCDFDSAIKSLSSFDNQTFLAVGTRLNFDWSSDVTLEGDYVAELTKRARQNGTTSWPYGTDYFFQNARDFIQFPRVAVGRPYWDTWLLWYALSQGWLVVDLTPSTQVLHPNHNYQHVPHKAGRKWKGPEGDSNKQLCLADCYGLEFTLADLNYQLSGGKLLRKRGPLTYWLVRPKALVHRIACSNLRTFTPYLIKAHRVLKLALNLAAASTSIVCLAWRLIKAKRISTNGEPLDDKDMQVLFITHTSCLYGANRSLLYLIQLLRSQGTRVSVVVPTDGPICAELEKLGVRFGEAPIPRGFSKSKRGRFRRLLASLVACHELKRRPWVKDSKIIYSNSAMTNVGAILSLMTGKRHVWHLREDPEGYFGQRPDWGWRFQSFLLRKAWKILVGSMYVRNRFSAHESGARYQHVENIAFSTREIEEFEKRRAIPDTCLRFGIVGRLDPGKRVALAIAAFSELAKERPLVRLAVVGGGERPIEQGLKSIVEQLSCREQISFHDFNPDRLELFSQIDCLIVAAPAEAFGRTTIEAMCLGIPVIGCDTGGTRELIIPGINGLSFLSDDPVDLTAKMTRMTDEESFFRGVSRSAAAWAKERFLSGSLETKYVQVFFNEDAPT